MTGASILAQRTGAAKTRGLARRESGRVCQRVLSNSCLYAMLFGLQFSLLNTRWHTRPLSRRAKPRGWAAPVRCEKSMLAPSSPKRGTLAKLLYHIWGKRKKSVLSFI